MAAQLLLTSNRSFQFSWPLREPVVNAALKILKALRLEAALRGSICLFYFIFIFFCNAMQHIKFFPCLQMTREAGQSSK